MKSRAFGAEEAHRFLRSRRSVRAFQPREIPADLVERILESATWAPNSHNRQAWAFVQLSSEQSRKALVEALSPHYVEALVDEGFAAQEAQATARSKNQRILDAPEAILVCLDTSRLDSYDDGSRDAGEKTIGQQSVALAGGQMLLAAHAEGLGAVWVCAPLFRPREVGEALDLAPELEAQAIILIGYPQEPPKTKGRRPLNEVVIKR